MRKYRQSVRGSLSFFAPIDSYTASNIVENAVSAGDIGMKMSVDLISEIRAEDHTGYEFLLSGETICEGKEYPGSEFDPPEFDTKNAIDIDEIRNEIERLLKGFEIDYVNLKEEFEAA